MKKTLSLVLTLVMLLSVCTFITSYAPVSAATVLGDLNGDGEINAKDSLLLKKYVAGYSVSINLAAADLNGDGDVGSKDCRVLREYLAGSITSFSGTSTYGLKKLEIAGNDISQYDIISNRPADGYYARDCYAYGVRMFRNYINDACGYKLPIVGVSDGLTTDGRFRDDPENGAGINTVSSKPHHIYMIWEDSNLGQQGYSWSIDENGDFTIRGGYRTGIMNSTFDFLDEYIGWRFYEYCHTVLIPSDYVNVPAGLQKTYIPQMTYRDVHTSQWIIEYGGNYDVELLCAANHINSHDDRAYCQSAKYGWGKGNVWAHAHSFSLIFSGTDYSQPCLSNGWNEVVAEGWVNNLLAERSSDENPAKIGYELTRVAVSWNDNTNYCLCDGCTAIYRQEESIAGAIVRFNNNVAQGVRASGWDVHIYYIAYGTARIPPKYARPNDYCDICYCWNGCNNHTFDSNECDENGDVKGWTNWKERYFFEFWAKIAKNLETWYYATSFSWNVGPCPNVLNVRRDFRYWADHGVSGIYAEAMGNATDSFESLRNYIMARCIWNPYMSEQEFQRRIDEFLEYRYGAGWRYIKEYLYIADEAGNRNGCFTNNFDWPGDMYNLSYMYENYDHVCQLFDNAKAMADGWQRENIEKLSIHMHFLSLSGAVLVNGNGTISNSSKLSSRYDEMYNYAQRYGFVASIYGGLNSNGYNKYLSPMISWLDLEVLDARWESWYISVGRPLPRDDPKDPENAGTYLSEKPTKTYNPLSKWVP